MNFTNLKYFYDTAVHRSTKKAAKLNHVSQPAISQGIRKLETELVLDLMNHKRKTVELTADGKSVVVAAERLFESIGRYHREIEGILAGDLGKINVGVSNSLVSIILSPALKSFSKRFPNIDVVIKLGKTSDQVRMLEQGEIDVGITIDDGTLEKFRLKSLKRGTFVLAGRTGVSERLITTEPRPETAAFKSMNNQFRDYSEVESWSTIVELAKAGYGHGLVPDFLVTSEQELRLIPIKGKLDLLKYTIVSITSGQSLSLAQKSFLSFLESST